MRNAFKALLIVLIFTGCSARWHLKKAIQKGAFVKSDTVYVDRTVYVPEVKTDTVFTSLVGDTIRIEKEKLRIKYVRLPGDSVYIEGKCLPDTLRIKVPVSVDTDIHAPDCKWKLIHIIGAAILFLVVGLIIGKILK